MDACEDWDYLIGFFGVGCARDTLAQKVKICGVRFAPSFTLRNRITWSETGRGRCARCARIFLCVRVRACACVRVCMYVNRRRILRSNAT